MEILVVKDLHVVADGKEILKGVDLDVKKGEVVAVIGPNASGKTTLAKAIMGIPGLKVKGKIIFEGKDITSLPLYERAKAGIAMSFQHPPKVRNVKLKDLLAKIKKVEEIPILDEFSYLLARDVNVGFSGGERKISELIQLMALDPKLVILDEIDAGLDVSKLKKVVDIVKKYLIKNGRGVLLITHQGDVLKLIKPDRVAVMLAGKVICQQEDWKKVWRTIKRYGYERCKECLVSSD